MNIVLWQLRVITNGLHVRTRELWGGKSPHYRAQSADLIEVASSLAQDAKKMAPYATMDGQMNDKDMHAKPPSIPRNSHK